MNLRFVSFLTQVGLIFCIINLVNAQNDVPSFEFLSMNSPLVSISAKGSTVVASSNYGSLLYSNNYGESFQGGSTNVHQDYTSVSMANDSIGWAVTSSGAIFKTIDGGIKWTAQTSPALDLKSVNAINENVAYACGGGGISTSPDNFSVVVKTTDGGMTWSKLWTMLLFRLIWMALPPLEIFITLHFIRFIL